MADVTPLNAEAVAMGAAKAWAIANAPMASEPARFGESVGTVYRSVLTGCATSLPPALPRSVAEAATGHLAQLAVFAPDRSEGSVPTPDAGQVGVRHVLDDDLPLASGAPLNDRLVSPVALYAQHGFHPLVKARLAEVVHRLCVGWNASVRGLDFGLHDEVARSEFDQRVTAALLQGCLQFQVLLLSVDQLLLQSPRLAGDRKETLLRIEQLAVHLGDGLRELARVAHAYGCTAEVVCRFQRPDQAGDQVEVHG